MRISLRDERGQAVLEYILTLIIAVAIIFGGLYQLNTAFKAWASNYFGDYLSCLLETGDLPSISGTGGDAGTCNRLFKPFSLAEGRRLAAVGKTGGAGAKVGNPVAASERGGGGSGGGYNGTPFTAGRAVAKPPGDGQGAGRSKITPTNTGSTEISNYGTPYTGRAPLRPVDRVRIDTHSGIDDAKDQTARQIQGSAKSPDAFSSESHSTKIHPPQGKKQGDDGDGQSFTVGDFMRYLIIAAMIIALLMFLGGQALNIGKSMD